MTVTQVDSKELCVKCTLIETEWRDESGDPVCALCQDDDAMRKRAEAAEARAAQAEQERDELRRQLEQAQALADVDSADALTDWIVGAQSEIYNLAGQLRNIWEAHAQGPQIELGDETPLGQLLDGQGDEVEP